MNSWCSKVGVPSYDLEMYSPTRSRWACCVFVINEGQRVRAQLRVMKDYSSLVDIFVCDGGSTDGSLEFNYLEGCGVAGLLVKTGPGALGAQMRMAFDFVLSQGYDGVICVDGNGKDGVEAIPRFVAALERGVDHSQGSRYVVGGYHKNTPWLRKWGVRLLHAPLLRFASGFPYTDTTNGFRAYSRKFLLHPGLVPLRDVFVGYEFHYYLAVKAARLGLQVEEIPVSRVYPAGEKAPTKISPIKGNLKVLWSLFSVVLGRYNPN